MSKFVKDFSLYFAAHIVLLVRVESNAQSPRRVWVSCNYGVLVALQEGDHYLRGVTP